jgi:hypothetical protein
LDFIIILFLVIVLVIVTLFEAPFIELVYLRASPFASLVSASSRSDIS